MALGNATLGETGWGGGAPMLQQILAQLPALPISTQRKTLKMKDLGDGTVRMTYSMSIQKPKGAPDVSTDVTVGQMTIKITPTTTPGWSMLTVSVIVAKP